MNFKIYYLILLMLSITVLSCNSEDEAPLDNNNNNNDAFFIEATVDGEDIRAEYTCPTPGCDFVTGNYSEFGNLIYMERTVSDTDRRGWCIKIEDVDLDNWQIPDTLDASALFYQENLDLSYYSGPWQSDNNFSVDGTVLGYDSFEMIVTSKSDDIIEGTFSGELRNGSDTDFTVTVTDGSFRIQLIRI